MGPGQDRAVVQGLHRPGSDRGQFRALAARCGYAIHLGSPRPAWAARGSSPRRRRSRCCSSGGIGDTIRISLTPEPGGGPRPRGGRRPGDPADHGAARVRADGHRLSRLRADDQHRLPGAGRAHPKPCARQDAGTGPGPMPGVETMSVAVMGCIVNGPGESKHANIGISLPGTGEEPAAPVFIDGEKDRHPARPRHRRGVSAAGRGLCREPLCAPVRRKPVADRTTRRNEDERWNAPAKRFDLILRGGHVIDPAARRNGPADVAGKRRPDRRRRQGAEGAPGG